jgi:hypothetical protein
MQGNSTTTVILRMKKFSGHKNQRITQYLFRTDITFIMICIDTIKIISGSVVRMYDRRNATNGASACTATIDDASTVVIVFTG